MIKILTGYLDVAGYGLYSKIYNYLSLFAVIADLGLYTITVREISHHLDDKKMVEKISANVLTLRTLSGILICVISLGLAPFLSWYDSPAALCGIAIVSIFTLFGLINSSLMSYLQATLKTEFTLVANTSGKLLTFGMIFLFASVLFPISSWVSDFFKLTLILLAWLAGNILMTILTWWHASRFHHIHFGFDREYIIHILKVSLPYWLALFLWAISFKVDIILLSLMEEKHIADIAIALYSLPMKIVEVGMMYGTIFLNSLLPVLTESIKKDDTKKIHTLIKHALKLLFILWSSASLILFFFAPFIIRLISTDTFVTENLSGYTAVDAMRIVGFIFFFYFLSSLATYIMIARSEQAKMIRINIFVALINLIGNIIFIPHFSFIGSAWVTLITQWMLFCITAYTVRKDIKIL